VEQLRSILAKARQRPDFVANIQARDEVFARYQPIFTPALLPDLTEEDFRSFLYFGNNKHWTGLYRQAGRLTADMDALRQTLAVLLDEEQPLAHRFDDALSRIRGLGKALASAILLVVYPERYGVWNNTSESGLKILDIWPQFERGMSVGQKYALINDLFLRLSEALNIDLWTLDWLWWELVQQEEEGPTIEGTALTVEASEQRFRLERHLHDFLVTNWDQTELGREWTIYREPDDELAGYEYPTGVGRIDILARHKERPAWLVVELKRDRAADRTLGQVLRYIGWIKRHLAAPNEEVYGLIIAADVEKNLLYSLEGVNDRRISLMQYRVEFHLEPVNVEVE
ncbi:MAG: DUF1016 family protein, partial [Chloroflexi bacterium]|nr:DUF1016 family protein [Chloroflexota bacterium]